MKESYIRRTLCANLRKAGSSDLFVSAMENSAGAGTPDLYYCYKGQSGWIELKYIKELPKKDTFKIPHYTLMQHMWLVNNRMAGSKSHLFIRIKDTYYLIDIFRLWSTEGSIDRSFSIQHLNKFINIFLSRNIF